jgi:hypothetical protein
MRIRTILKAAAVPGVMAAALLGTSAAAFASTGPTGSNANAGHLTGNQALSYQDPYFGGVQCNENQHPQFTNVTCKFVSGVPGSNTNGAPMTSSAANFTPGQTGQVTWVNDFGGNQIIGYDPTTGKPVPSTNGTLTFTITGPVGGTATGYTGQVVYNS